MDSKKAKRAVIGAMIALFANMGINSTFSIFLPSFMEEWGAENMATIALSATFGCIMTFICSTFLFGTLLKKIEPRVIFVICGILAVAYCLICSFASAIWMIIVAGLFGGINLAFGTHAMGVATITPYFGNYGAKVSTIIALVLASASVGATAFSFLPGALLGVMAWRQVYLVIMAIVLVCNIVAFFIIPKQQMSDAGAAAGAAQAQAAEIPGLTKGQALKTPSFWLVFLGILFLSISYLGISTYMPSLLTTYGMAQSTASAMQGIMQGVGILFVFLGGAITNKLGIKGLILLTAVPLVAGALVYALVYPNLAVVWLAVICSVLCVTGAMTSNICPVITATLFGNKDLNSINPIFSGGAFWGGAALATQVIGRVVTATGSFSKGYITAAAICVVGTALLFLALAANPMKKKAA